MGFVSEWVQYGERREYTGYAAKPVQPASGLPAVLVLQEIFGVDEHIQDVADRLARAGYAAFAPDLFSRNGQRPAHLTPERIEAAKSFMEQLPSPGWRDIHVRNQALSVYPQEQQNHIMETIEGMFAATAPAQHLEQMLATSRFVQEQYAATKGAKFAALGFCMGGALSGYFAVHEPRLSCAVVFYGNPPAIETVASVQCPVIGFYGQLDTAITEKIPAFAEAMKKHGKSFEYHVYDETPHAFFNDTRKSYRIKASRDAYSRSLDFLNRHLGS
ncbi:dienelactone hydrolase family protein [Paenibacillus naphthalenovorans]|uniref:dienelactone hydrolase family protein n=1 Tax=Paenibacillus naphthalenovorans TaxID=162209 RepID=UPI0008872968|nr:dienelactone hydrolase family protein [Paenibacillus naphthalenovorans]SDJ30428.1 carboxymethylenebutenolidase [Paenibacillus naphthalenovorans]